MGILLSGGESEGLGLRTQMRCAKIAKYGAVGREGRVDFGRGNSEGGVGPPSSDVRLLQCAR